MTCPYCISKRSILLLFMLIYLFFCGQSLAAIDYALLDNGFGFDVGYGGPHSAPSLGASYINDSADMNYYFELNVALIFCSEGELPKGILNYPCPHDGWIEYGTYKSDEAVLTFANGRYISNNIVFFVQIGWSGQIVTEIQQSTATGWYYKGSEKNNHSFSYGAGLRYILGERNGKRSKSIKLEYNNRRGISVGYGATFF